MLTLTIDGRALDATAGGAAAAAAAGAAAAFLTSGITSTKLSGKQPRLPVVTLVCKYVICEKGKERV